MFFTKGIYFAKFLLYGCSVVKYHGHSGDIAIITFQGPEEMSQLLMCLHAFWRPKFGSPAPMCKMDVALKAWVPSTGL